MFGFIPDNISQWPNVRVTEVNVNKNRFLYLPKCPPDVEAHCVQPEKRRQEQEVHAHS